MTAASPPDYADPIRLRLRFVPRAGSQAPENASALVRGPEFVSPDQAMAVAARLLTEPAPRAARPAPDTS